MTINIENLAAKSSGTTATYYQATDFFFKPDGTRLYTLASDPSNSHPLIVQYTLSTAGDPSTLSDRVSFDIYGTLAVGSLSGLAFNATGTKMYVIGGIVGYSQHSRIQQFSLSTAWNITTASADASYRDFVDDFGDSSGTCDVSTLRFSSAGTKMFVYVYYADNDHQLRLWEYSLSTAWAISTLTLSANSYYASGGRSFCLNSDGTKLYLGTNSYNDSSTSNTISQYSLGTAWSLSSVTSDNKSYQGNIGTRSLFLNNSDANFYTNRRTSSLSTFTLYGNTFQTVRRGKSRICQYYNSARRGAARLGYDNYQGKCFGSAQLFNAFTNAERGNAWISLVKVTRNIVRNGLYVSIGENKLAVLPPLHIVGAKRGQSRTLGTFYTSRYVLSSIGQLEAAKNVITASGHNVVLGRLKNVSLPALHVTRIMRGVSNIGDAVITVQRAARGTAQIYANFQCAARGTSRCVWVYCSTVQRGTSTIHLLATTAMRGTSTLWNSIPSAMRGKSTLWNNFNSVERGVSNILFPLPRTIRGRSRIANDALEGYTVYIGRGEAPDFTNLAGFSTTLPVSVSVTPPVSGEEELWIVRRRRSKYGLESQNQFVYKVKIDSSGNLVYGPLSAPIGLELVLRSGGEIYLRVYYPGVSLDQHPATKWFVFAKTGEEPDPEVDTPTGIYDITGDMFGLVLSGFTPGTTVYIAVYVYREADSMLSERALASIALPELPVAPAIIPNGYELD